MVDEFQSAEAETDIFAHVKRDLTPPPIRIGDLLVGAGMVDQETLDSCTGLALRMHVPLGRILSMEGHLTEELLMKALNVQDMIRANTMTVEIGLKVLKVIRQQGLTVDEAFARVSVLPSVGGVKASRLGDLLRESAAATQKQIEAALVEGLEASLPLGQVLLNRGIITFDLLSSALIGLRIISDGIATRPQVLQALRSARLRKVPLLEPLSELGVLKEDPYQSKDVGDILYLAGLVNERELIAAREIAITEDKTVEQSLISCGFSTQKGTLALNELLLMLKEGALQEEQILQLTKKLQTVDWDIPQVLAALDEYEEFIEEEIEVGDLLKLTGCIHPEDLEIATNKSLTKRQPLATSLMEAGFITQTTLHAAHNLKSYIQQGIVNMEQARTLLAYCHENDLDIDTAIIDFNWLPAVMRA